jgi:branched-chain amino acid transport system substrate-binding protein
MRKTNWKPALAAVTLLAAGLFGAAASAQTLKIGVIGPLTGGGAPWGNAAAEAARFAAADANANGGLTVGSRKYKVEVIAYDDQYKAADAVAAYTRLTIQDGVRFVMAVTSPATLALASRVEADKTIFVTSAGAEKAVDPKSRQMFRMISLLRDYVPPMVGWIKSNYKERRVFVLNPNDDSGWASTEIAKGAYAKHGFEIIGSELFERTQKDFTPLLTKVMAQKPEIIELASTSPATAGLIVRQARDLGYKGMFVKNSGAAVADIVATAGNAGAEGVISLHFADPGTDGYKRLAERYKKSFNQMPDDLIVVYYDATNALLQAIQKGGDADDTAKVSDALFNKVFPMKSAQGAEIALGGKAGQPGDPNQIVTVSYISVIKNGVPVIVGSVK